MPRVRHILTSLLALALLATLFAGIHSRHTPDYLAVCYNYRGPKDERIGGTRACYLIAAHGQIGIMVHTQTYGWLEPGQTPNGPSPTRFFWKPLDDESLGDDLSYAMKSSHAGLSLYDDVSAGLGSEETLQGFLLNAWLVGLLLAMPLGFLAWRAARRRQRRLAGGQCPGCGYDVRTQLRGQAGGRCPECGMPIKRVVVLPGS